MADKKKKKSLSKLFIGGLKNRVKNSKYNQGGKKDFLGLNRNARLEQMIKDMDR
jgi:hypothetical protein